HTRAPGIDGQTSRRRPVRAGRYRGDAGEGAVDAALRSISRSLNRRPCITIYIETHGREISRTISRSVRTYPMMTFDVLFPVYINDEPDAVKQALGSVVTQSRLPTRIVVVCDGPTTHDVNSV